MSNRHTIVYLVAMLCFAMLCPSSSAKRHPRLVRIKVHVANPDDRPVRNAGVVIKQLLDEHGHRAQNPLHIELKSDQDGNSSIDLFEAGTIEVQVIASGYQTWGGAYKVLRPDNTIRIKLAAPQSQISIYPK